MYTVEHTLGYHSQKFIRACTKLPAHAHGTKIRGGNFKWFKNFCKTSNGWFATDLQDRIQMSDGDPRTGRFYQMLVTMVDTACSVKGL